MKQGGATAKPPKRKHCSLNDDDNDENFDDPNMDKYIQPNTNTRVSMGSRRMNINTAMSGDGNSRQDPCQNAGNQATSSKPPRFTRPTHTAAPTNLAEPEANESGD